MANPGLKPLVGLCFCIISQSAGCAPLEASDQQPEPVRQVVERAVPAGFTYETILSGLDQATSLAFLPDNRLLIGQKGGLVRVAALEAGSWTLRPTPFIDLEDQTNSALDRGLLSVAVHPNFPTTPWVYVYHAYDPPGLPNGTSNDGSRVARVLRITADATANYEFASNEPPLVLVGKNGTLANLGDADEWNSTTLLSCQGAPSAPHVVDCIPNDSNNHAGGMLAFGLDGSLFVATGDATPPNGNPRAVRSQYLDSLAGKLLRVDAETGLGLSDNPFFDGDPASNRARVYSYGLRNPYRIAVHPTSGEVYVGDVGWNSWEELDQGRGQNFGWPCYEGDDNGSLMQDGYSDLPECQTLYAAGAAAVKAPLYAYAHDPPGEFGASIILGDFYVGTSYPEALRGNLFFYDFNDTWMRAAAISDVQVQISNFGTQLGNDNDYENGIVHVVSGPDSNLYTANLSTIRRLRYTVGNTPPIAVATATPESGKLPLLVAFDGSGSSDPEGTPLTYEWSFGDGARSPAMSPTHTYGSAGVFEAVLTVTDAQGETASASVTINAGNEAPVVTISAPPEGASFAVGDTISFVGSALDPESGDLSPEIAWELLLHHNDHTHSDVFSTSGASGSFVVEDHGELNWNLELCAQATDDMGLSARACRVLPARTVSYCFETSPPGLELSAAGTTRATPFNVDAVIGSALLIGAPTPQMDFAFQEWAHGGARTQSVAIGQEGRVLQAVYSGPPGAVPVSDAGTGPKTCTELADAESPKAGEGEPGCSCRVGRRSDARGLLMLAMALVAAHLRRRVR